MDSINIIDPNTGTAHAIPYDQLPDALEAGGQFADEAQKQKAIQLQQGHPGTIDAANVAGTGLTGVAADAMDLFGNALSKGVNFITEIPENLEKSGQYINEHPFKSVLHNAGQLLAESADIGKSIFNSSYNLNQYLARKHLLPQVLGRMGKLIPHIPEDTGIESALRLKEDQQKGDSLVRAIPDLATALLSVKSTTKPVSKLLKGPDLKQALKDTQSTVKAADKDLGEAFNLIEAEVERRGVTPIPVDKQTINQAKRFLDKSPETKELIEQASKGDYKALRAIQSDLRVLGEDALSNKLSTERNIGKEALSTRNKINNAIQKHFEKTGHEDLASLLEETKEGYKSLQDTYFSSPALAKVFGKSQKIPKNPLTLLTEDSTEMNRFFGAHPEVKHMLEKSLKHKGKKKAVMVGLGVLGTGSTAGITSHILGK